MNANTGMIKFMVAGISVLAVASCAGTPDSASTRMPVADKIIAISFDDGPFDHTDRLLGILAENNVKATFFFVGQNMQERPEQTRRVLDAGHEIGNHSWGFSSLGDPSPGRDAISESLGNTSAVIGEISGSTPVLFRAPNLNYGDDLSSVAGEMGLAIIGATSFSMDWEGIPTQEIVSNVLAGAADGGIILLHEFFDGSDRTERAVPQIVNALRSRGFEIVTVSELASRKGATLQAGTLYNGIN